MSIKFYNFKLIKILSVFSLLLWLIIGIWFMIDYQRASEVGSRVFKGLTGDYSVRSVGELLDVIKRGLIYKLGGEEIPKLFLDIKYKDLLILENQRTNVNKSKKKEYVNAILSIKEKDKEKHTFKVKVRSKGDRKMHKLNISEMSMKIDIRGKKRLLGMEEFSLQKPIVRNYTWEALLHLIMKGENILALKQVPVRFFRNGVDLGIFFIEEGFGKELLESQKRKLGPIIGIDENFGSDFPNIYYDFHNEKKIIKKIPGIYEYTKEKLNNLKKNYNTNEYKVEENFDLDLWAKFFAISDLFESYHGTVPKSVKLYYNPSSTLFEPILFDGHVGAGEFKSFILLDFLNINTLDIEQANKRRISSEFNEFNSFILERQARLGCRWICTNKDWYMLFLKNSEFLAKYYYWLERYSSNDFIDNIMDTVDRKIEPINNAIYSELGLSDNVLYKGMLPFYFNKNKLKIRSTLIRKKLEETGRLASFISDNLYIGGAKCSPYNDDKNVLIYDEKGLYSTTCKKIKNENKQKNDIQSYSHLYDKLKLIDLSQCNTGCQINDNGSIEIESGLWFINNLSLEDVNIKLLDNATLVMMGDTKITGNVKKIQFEGRGSITQLGGSILLKNVQFDNLISPSIKGVNWSGSINIINSNAVLSNVVISNNKSEDSINIVNSKTKIVKISIFNALSDGVDVDFGHIDFDSIYCDTIGNDCLDTSGSTVQGKFLQGVKVDDKLISFGEGSTGKIREVYASDVDIVAVSKDSSLLTIDILNAERYKVLAAAFTKKSFFGAASLSINNCNQCLKNNPIILNGTGNTINIESLEVPDTLSSNKVESLMYGGEYGRATVK